MMSRIIGSAMWTLMVVLGVAAAFEVFAITRAATLNNLPLIFQAFRALLLTLGALIMVSALYSIGKRLTAIETKMNDR